MSCTHCHASLDVGLQFCPHCGTKQSNSTAAQEETAAAHAAESSNHATTTNDTVAKVQENVSKTSKEFWVFVKEHVRRPVASSEQSGADQWINGIITIVLTALMLPLSMFLLYQIHDEYISGFFRMGYGLFREPNPFMMLLIRPFFIILTLLAVIYGALFVSTRLMKSACNYKDVLGRFGAYMVIPLALFVIMFGFSLIGLYKIALLFLVFGFLGVNTSISYTIYSLRHNHSAQGIDPFYAVLLTYLIVGIVYLIIG